ncbi:GRB10-interacting GYF protein 2 isoform X2 [Folsomia candida]|uniref:GRB10-interacting GYF protein 2 isoform X2 n=1 Tax=Folsomia candida TaxID=158441 RepID=UPI000B8FAFCE|nr:GRB10-interacting GYF protein 2 isoform X2 [Folsomia candida]
MRGNGNIWLCITCFDITNTLKLFNFLVGDKLNVGNMRMQIFNMLKNFKNKSWNSNRLDNERKGQVAAEREVKFRQERERELKLQQQAQFSWNTATVQPNASQNMEGSDESKSLLEIQQKEAIKQEKEQASQKKKAQQEQLRQQQAQQQKAINLKWVDNAGAVPTKQAPIKSLTEIQAEEQAKQQDQEREKRAIINQQQQKQAVWSAQLPWADRALAGTGGGSSNSSGGGAKKVTGGVWDDSSMGSMAWKLKGSNNPLPSSAPSSSSNSNNRGPAVGKKTKEISDDSFMKLFSVQQDGAATNQKAGINRPKMTQQAADEFTRWCSDRIQAIASGSVDIPTFVSFLKEVQSPYEVGDYVRSYLGDGKEAKEFSREFLDRRSRWKNAHKGNGSTSPMEDNLCRPASVTNPKSSNTIISDRVALQILPNNQPITSSDSSSVTEHAVCRDENKARDGQQFMNWLGLNMQDDSILQNYMQTHAPGFRTEILFAQDIGYYIRHSITHRERLSGRLKSMIKYNKSDNKKASERAHNSKPERKLQMSINRRSFYETARAKGGMPILYLAGVFQTTADISSYQKRLLTGQTC